ncbi:MAG: hypothetical protein WB780_03680, partial [Candidatus Acidiferrales bacterium]
KRQESNLWHRSSCSHRKHHSPAPVAAQIHACDEDVNKAISNLQFEISLAPSISDTIRADSNAAWAWVCAKVH